ncbi:MAG: UDP-N-acetylmuramoylalanyl-D-glutamate--2,6-diaminopimelate ligase [Candidatus Ozemobacter sibiricus]|uniref:UDP-N-acetylmuramoyl-L-alanyl-D-glutamate--2,6-diaminopimelate ligase n=1 Tax=Candidatus Ozemobacter sibiricus TaxID=2268124 RepID=A0A367ZVH3_9BACT|nr:MAG: UDP-N-acetylmuramoylalanyl-D-glutamate--2,6-diaminopimelate ligase [Candidatus Ozemobacter sibiricus]
MLPLPFRQLHPRTVLASRGHQDVPISSVTFDSRQVSPGSLFVALPGATVDGATFIDDAIRRGAAAIVTEIPIDGLPVPAIQVPDARRALSEIACTFYGHPSSRMTVIGITGTKGKTTTTYLIQSILRRAHGQAFRLGTVEYDLGFTRLPARNTTPESLELVSLLAQALKKGVTAGVMEVSSHALKTWRVEDLTFAAAGFTNLSLEHSEFHPTMEDYYQAKRRLFLELLPRGRPAVIGIDDEWGRRLAEDCRQAGIRFRTLSLTNPQADFVAADLAPNAVSQRFTLVAQGQRIPIDLPLVGSFNVANAMMAAALCQGLGIPWAAITEGLATVGTVPGRFETIPNARGLTVIVDYAHSPAALQNVLAAARPLTKGRLITVFGCGGNRSREKRPVMGRLSATLSDITVVTSDNPRKEKPEDIIAEIMAGITPLAPTERGEVQVEPDRRKAIALAIGLARPGDLVLIAGKGHETGQTFADRTIPFDDREVAREYLEGPTHA